MFTVTTERPEDRAAIDQLLDRAFGPGRMRKMSYRFRDGVDPVANLQLVARGNDGALLGTVRCWPIAIGAMRAPALLLGPIAVEPALKGQGIGAALMFATLDMAAWAGHRLVLLVGDLDYYQRFGFVPAATHGFVMPGEKPQRLLVHALDPAALGTIHGVLQPAAALYRKSAA
ncbi:MAG: N-acetyltransferase [Alphaproteobacteria bacterium]|nr:N-acetyltransferase [Alphaproteobacteria bacterium]